MHIQTIDRWRERVLLLVTFLVPVAFWRPALEIFLTVKVTVVLVGAWVCALIAVARWATIGAIKVRSRIFVAATVALVVALIVAMGASELPWRSMFGQYGRWTGALPYLGYIILGLTAMAVSSQRLVGWFLVVLTVANAIVAGYAAIQIVGLDPLVWAGTRDATSTMGNVDFTAAYIGITAAAPMAFLLDGRSGVRLRSASAAVLVLDLWILSQTAAQGMLALLAGTLVLGAVVVTAKPAARRFLGAWRRPLAWGLLGLVALAAVVALTVGLDAAQAGRLGAAAEARSLQWSAALRMWRDSPLLGVGPDLFGSYWTKYQPASYQFFIARGGVDNPHSVPFWHLSGGGVLVLLAWLGVIGATLFAAVRGLMNADGGRRLSIGALLAVWVAYQVQSLVSMDLASVGALHWLTAGMLVGLASPDVEFSVPLTGGTRRSSRTGGSGKRATGGVAGGVFIVLAMILVAGLWPTTRLLRADVAAKEALALGATAVETNSPALFESARAEMKRAQALAPWEAMYHNREAELLFAAREIAPAFEAQRTAAELAPGRPLYWRNAAEMAYRLERVSEAEELWLHAVRNDPANPHTLVGAAQFMAATGDRQGALATLDQLERLIAGALASPASDNRMVDVIPGVLTVAIGLLEELGAEARASQLHDLARPLIQGEG